MSNTVDGAHALVTRPPPSRRDDGMNFRLALALSAFRAPEPLHDLDQPRVPSGDRRKGPRIYAASVAALASQEELVLPEFVGELVDMELARHGRDCEETNGDPSIQSRRSANTVCRRHPEGAP